MFLSIHTRYNSTVPVEEPLTSLDDLKTISWKDRLAFSKNSALHLLKGDAWIGDEYIEAAIEYYLLFIETILLLYLFISCSYS